MFITVTMLFINHNNHHRALLNFIHNQMVTLSVEILKLFKHILMSIIDVYHPTFLKTVNKQNSSIIYLRNCMNTNVVLVYSFQ